MLELSTFGETLAALKNMKGKGSEDQKRMLIIRTCKNKDTFQARLWMYALNPYLTWGVSKIPARGNAKIPSTHPLDQADLVSLLDDLSSRRLTGYAAEAEVLSFFNQLDDNAKYGFRAIITKKPRCGVSSGLLNKIWPGWIPTFKVCKAMRWNENDCKAMINKWGGAIVEVKLDGERRIYIHHLDGSSQFLTKTGNEDHGFPYILAYLDVATEPGTVLDGELIGGDGKLGTRQTHLSQYIGSTIINGPACGVKFSVFDVMTLDDWTSQTGQITQNSRTEWVENLYAQPDSATVPAHATYLERVSSLAQLEDLYLDMVDMGYEGVIVKSPGGLYEFKTTASKNWIKRKFETDEEVTILDVLPGDAGGKFEFEFGRFWCKRENGVFIHVGRGQMKEAQAQWTWDNRVDLPGKIIEILHNGETPDGSLNNPRFFAYREDKVTP